MKPKNFALYAALIACLTPTLSHAAPVAQWKVGLYGRSTDDSLSSSKTVGVAGIVNLNRDLATNLQARFLGGVLLETGSSSALFTNEFEPRSRLLMQEASLRWSFLKSFSLLGGVLDQRHHGSPLLVESGSFPAAMLAFDNGPGGFILHADGQAAIPVSRTYSTRAAGKDSTPLLLTQKIILGWEDPLTEFKALLRATHFKYGGLTHGLAQDSRFYGNAIVGPGLSSTFLYDYEGIEGGADFKIPVARPLHWNLGFSYLQNLKGPRQADEGAFAYTGFTVRTSGLIIKPAAQWYWNQSDSAPGFFTSTEFGHNNRRGLGASLRFELKDPGLQLELKARRSRLIQPLAFQRDQFDYVEFSLEIPYADF